MVPEIERLKSMEVCRDGGSLTLMFRGKDGNEYCLMLPVSHCFDGDLSGVAGQAPFSGFDAPLLERYVRHEYKSSVTGLVCPDWKRSEESLSWSDAKLLLHRAEPHLDEVDAGSLWVHVQMLGAVSREGSV